MRFLRRFIFRLGYRRMKPGEWRPCRNCVRHGQRGYIVRYDGNGDGVVAGFKARHHDAVAALYFRFHRDYWHVFEPQITIIPIQTKESETE